MAGPPPLRAPPHRLGYGKTMQILSGLLAAVGCTGAEDGVIPEVECGEGGVAIAPSADVVTVAEASWPGQSDRDTRLEIHDNRGALLATDWRGDGEQQATLVGVTPDAVNFAKLVDADGNELASCTFDTEPLPTTLPELDTTGTAPWDGIVATSIMGGAGASLVVDEEGNIRWYYLTDPGVLYRTRVAPDGGGVYILWEQDSDGGTDAYVARISWTGEFERVSGELHPSHDFMVLDDGTLGIITSYMLGDSANVGLGAGIAEVSPNGAVTELWDSRDGYWGDNYNEAEPEKNSVRGNVLRHDEATDNWWIGLRDVSSIAVVERDSGETLDRIGGFLSEWSFGADASFQNQHGWDFVDGGIRLHDNREGSDQTSRVITLALDAGAQAATLVNEMAHDPPVFVYAMGDVQVPDNDSTIVSWSTSGLLDGFDSNGTLGSSTSLPMGSAFGYVEHHDAFPGQVELR